MSRQTKNIISIAIKAAILILAFGFIYNKLSNNQNIADFKKLVKDIPGLEVWLILGLIFALMLLNWFLESLKWKYLIRKVQPLSTWKAVESVFCGLTWAVFTPNRIGEFGGRVFFLAPRKRVMGLVSMGVGAVSQMVITNIFGSLALLWFVSRFMELNPVLNYAIAFLVFVFCGFFLMFYFNIQWIDSLLSRLKFMQPYRKYIRVFSYYSQSELLRVMLYSFARFAVFTSQYYLVIHMLVPDINYVPMVMIIFILYFVQSALPSLAFLDIGVRAFTAGYFFSFITSQDLAIMVATACIWLINIIIPAILGSVFVLKLNFFDKPAA